MSNPEKFDLKKYLLEDFKDIHHKNASLLVIYLYDPKYYASLLNKDCIDSRALQFFYIKEDDLKSIRKDEYLNKRARCESVVDQYIEEEEELLNTRRLEEEAQRQREEELLKAKRLEEEAQRQTEKELRIARLYADNNPYVDNTGLKNIISLTEDEKNELFSPESFICRDYGFDQYLRDKDGEIVSVFDEESLDLAKEALESSFLDELITPESFEQFLINWQVPYKYYFDLAKYAAMLNSDTYHNALINEYIIDKNYKPDEILEVSKDEDWDEDDMDEDEKILEATTEDSSGKEDEGILLDTFDELAYFNRKNTKNKMILCDGVIHILNVGDIKQIGLIELSGKEISINQIQGDAVDYILRYSNNWYDYKLTIRGIKKGLSIIECESENDSVQLAIVVFDKSY